MVIGILDRGSISASISKFTPQIDHQQFNPQQKTIQTQDLIEKLRPNLPSITGYREPPRDNCLEAVHLVERLDWQKGWVDTPHHHESDLPPIREKNIWCIGVWLWDLPLLLGGLYLQWRVVCYCFALNNKFHLEGENGWEKTCSPNGWFHYSRLVRNILKQVPEEKTLP